MDPVAVVIFILGAMIGSFLNVCIVRMPQERSVVFPGSHCGHCGASIAWHDNIPLVSWVLLKGKCRKCGKGFSVRYWLVELLTACVFVAFYQYYGLAPVLWPYLFMAGCFIVATFVDFAHRIIPDEISIGGMFAGVIFSALIPQLHNVKPSDNELSACVAGVMVLICVVLTWIYPIFCKHLMEDYNPADDRGVRLFVAVSLLLAVLINAAVPHAPAALAPHLMSFSAALTGYIIGGGVIYAMGLFGDIVFKKESMGGGDVKLMALVGAFMGWKLALLSFFLAPFFGAVYGIVEKLRTKESAIAYGPFLVLAALVSLFWGDMIITWIIRGGMYGQ